MVNIGCIQPIFNMASGMHSFDSDILVCPVFRITVNKFMCIFVLLWFRKCAFQMRYCITNIHVSRYTHWNWLSESWYLIPHNIILHSIMMYNGCYVFSGLFPCKHNRHANPVLSGSVLMLIILLSSISIAYLKTGRKKNT